MKLNKSLASYMRQKHIKKLEKKLLRSKTVTKQQLAEFVQEQTNKLNNQLQAIKEVNDADE